MIEQKPYSGKELDSQESPEKQDIYISVQEMLKTKGWPYSPEAQKAIEEAGSTYAEDLILEAAKLARREQAQQISTGHIDEAKQRILSIDRRNHLKRFSIGVGGAIFGVSSSPFLALLGSSPPSTKIIIAGAVGLVIGIALLMFGAHN